MSTCSVGSSSQRIIVIGAGIGGLASALALHRHVREVLVVERDLPPPVVTPTAAFTDWQRGGVPQFRHTHTFLARLQTMLRQHHPELLGELLAAGFESATLDQTLPAPLLERFAARPSDAQLLQLQGRRATFEYVTRRYAERLPNVSFMHACAVEKLLAERSGRDVHVRGLEVRSGAARRVLEADVVVDASGARSRSVDQLNALGAGIRTETVAAQIAYYCRHFQRHELAREPLRRNLGSTLDYLVYGVFLAEHGSFSVAFACPDTDHALLNVLKQTHGFSEICRQIPALACWTRYARPVSKILGGAQLANSWRHYPQGRGAAQVLGFFPVGDAYIQTNPIYGRGCASAFVQAHALGAAVAAEADPKRRARAYHRDVWRLMRSHYRFCTNADAGFLARAKHAQHTPLTPAERVLSHGFEQVFLPALEQSPLVTREWGKLQQMAEGSPPWTFVAVMLRMLILWCLRLLRARDWQLPKLGPTRDELLRILASDRQPFPVHGSASAERAECVPDPTS